MSDQLIAMPPYPWQLACWRHFVSMHSEKKLPHALLLAAPDGLGISLLARAMGQYLLCERPAGQGVCRECKACQLGAAGSHPDLFLVEPQTDSGQLLVDQIREVNEFVARTSQQGGYKVVVISPAHEMNQSAANALLKNLEEPAGTTLFFLVSHAPARLLPTVRSRCRILKVQPPDFASAARWLREQGIGEPEAVLQRVGNLPLLAQEWMDNNRLAEQAGILAALQSLLENALTTTELVKQWERYQPEAVLLAVTAWVEGLIKGENMWAEEFTPPRSSPRHLHLLFRFRDKLCQKKGLLEGTANVNSGLLLEEVVYDLHALGKSVSLPAIGK